MELLQPPLVNTNENGLILNTPNRNEILQEGPPQNSQCNILGRGAYGTVFKAIFRAKQVAVKIVKNLKERNMQSMRNEANILGWKHRNIVKILKIESTLKFGIVIMERFSGQCLQMVLDQVQLPLLHRVFISLDILSALEYCHIRNVLHLDVKPQNVLVAFGSCISNQQKPDLRNILNMQGKRRRNYICKLCDFGSSMKMLESDEHKENMVVKYGGETIAKGTVRYMSPEALREEHLTSAADIYSLAITMWQLKYRKLPYFWIECNEVVAYQVVKNNIRPSDYKHVEFSEADNQHQINLHMHEEGCFCTSYKPSYFSMGHIKQIDEYTNLLEKAIEGVNHQSNICNRRPLQSLHCCNTTNKEFPYYTGHARSAYGVEEVSYEAIYKYCWHSNWHLRPKAVELRQLLEDLRTCLLHS